MFAEQVIMNDTPSNLIVTGLSCSDWKYTPPLFLAAKKKFQG